VGDVIGKVPEPLPQGKHPQALALARPVPQGVKLGAEGLTHRRRDRCQFLRELEERVAQAGAKTRPREECAQTLGGAVEAISQNAADAIGRLLGDCRALEYLIRLGKGCCTRLRRIAQVPEDPTGDNRGQVHFVSETAAVLLIGQKIGG
jgi:hypothetical protein